MYFGFALDMSGIDFWNIDLLDTHLDLLSPDQYTDIPSKYFVCLQIIFRTSSRHVFKTSSRHVFKKFSRHVFKTSSRRLRRRKIVTLKTCWGCLQDMSWRLLQDVFKTNKCLLGWVCFLLFVKAWSCFKATFFFLSVYLSFFPLL